jgi:hypothetical protein
MTTLTGCGCPSTGPGQAGCNAGWGGEETPLHPLTRTSHQQEGEQKRVKQQAAGHNCMNLKHWGKE